MQDRPYVTNFQVEYRDEGMSFGRGTRSNVFGGGNRIIAKVEMELPPDTDPNVFLSKLKGDEMWSGIPAGSSDQATAALRHQLEGARQAAKDAEEKANEIARSLVTRETEIAQLKATASRHPDTEALLTLRRRMNVAIQAIEDTGLARELYEEVVREWSHTIAEGASFTQAEGDDLVERLVQFIQYIDTARATRKAETKPAVKPSSKKKDQLF
jgi:hypothetical protein